VGWAAQDTWMFVPPSSPWFVSKLEWLR